MSFVFKNDIVSKNQFGFVNDRGTKDFGLDKSG